LLFISLATSSIPPRPFSPQVLLLLRLLLLPLLLLLIVVETVSVLVEADSIHRRVIVPCRRR